MNTGFKLSNLKFRNATDAEVSRLVQDSRYRGDEARRSTRGFGPQRRRNEILAGQSSLRDGWYYDTVSVAANAAFTKQIMFSVPQGQAGKLLNSTNLTGQGGQVPAGETLIARSIRIYISNTTTPADFQNIINNVSVQFLVRNFPVYQCTPEFWPCGNGGVTLATSQVGTAPAGASAITSTSNGLPVQTAVYDFKNPYTMESQLNFNITLNPEVAFNLAAAGVNPAGVGTTIRVYIEGTKQQVVTS